MFRQEIAKVARCTTEEADFRADCSIGEIGLEADDRRMKRKCPLRWLQHESTPLNPKENVPNITEGHNLPWGRAERQKRPLLANLLWFEVGINWLLGMENVYVRLLLTHSRPPYVVLHKGSKQ